jgi:glutamate racemase
MLESMPENLKNNPIGIFDSGVGGLSVWREVQKFLPHENIVYLADSENCPYGSKSEEEIIKLSIQNTNFLLKLKCKLIIVACNTATAAAISTLRANYTLPFIGMEPAVKPAALNSNTGKIGVLATKGTFEGRLFKETSTKYAQHVDQIIQIGEGLVELVEQGLTDSEQSENLLKKHLKPMLDAGVDHIVLGCTHYPFFIPQILKLIPENIQLIDPAPAIAVRTSVILKENGLENEMGEPDYLFYSSGKGDVLKVLIKEIMGQEYIVNPVY